MELTCAEQRLVDEINHVLIIQRFAEHDCVGYIFWCSLRGTAPEQPRRHRRSEKHNHGKDTEVGNFCS
jgi:hypothetical protein